MTALPLILAILQGLTAATATIETIAPLIQSTVIPVLEKLISGAPVTVEDIAALDSAITTLNAQASAGAIITPTKG